MNNVNTTVNTNTDTNRLLDEMRNFETRLNMTHGILCYVDNQGKKQITPIAVEDNDLMLSFYVGGEVERIPIDRDMVMIKRKESTGIWNWRKTIDGREEIIANGGDTCIIMIQPSEGYCSFERLIYSFFIAGPSLGMTWNPKFSV